MNNLSKRGNVDPFRAIDVMTTAMALEREGRSIVHMAVGEPGARTPRIVRDAARNALNGRIAYTEALGMPALRQRISRFYAEVHRIEVPAERIAVTTGASAAFNLAFLAMFDVGDRVAMPTPAYPAYRNILKALSLEVVDIPTHAETRWTLTPDMLRAAHAIKSLDGLIVASPNNPNGTMISPPDLRALISTCRELGIRLIMDEIYHGLVYGFPTETALAATEDVVVINSFSKYYCMTGWRIGWMVLPSGLVRQVERLSQNIALSVNAVSQHAAIAAFDATEELETVKAGYTANRDYLLTRLPSLGFTELHPSDGAFYVYANVRSLTDDSVGFALRALMEAGVSLTPGVDFDPERGGSHLRFSFAGTAADMAEGLDRISAWLR